MPNVIFDIAALFTALASLIIALVAIRYTRKSVEQQQEHNVNAVRPICALTSSTLRNSISLTFRNNGTGPMRIIEALFISKNEGIYNSLRGLIREEYYKQYNALVDNPSISFITNNLTKNGSFRAGYDMKLLNFTQVEDSNKSLFRQAKLQILEIMGEIRIEVRYKDMYHNEYKYMFPLNNNRNPFKLHFERVRDKKIEDNELSEIEKHPPLEKTLIEILEVLDNKLDCSNKYDKYSRRTRRR